MGKIHLLNLRTILIGVASIVLSGCAHYFSSNISSEPVVRSIPTLPLCIAEDNTLAKDNIKYKMDHSFYTKATERIEKKYPQLKFDCSATQRYNVKFYQTQKGGNSDLFILTLGIFPLIAKTSYNLIVIDPKDKVIYKSQNSGTVIASIFFTPFFFLHDSLEDTIFEEVDRFLSQFQFV